MIIDTPDALLVAAADAIGRLGDAVKLPEISGLKAPGGCRTQRMAIKPGASSGRRVHDGATHWIVVSGAAQVKVNDGLLDLGPNQSAFAPPGAAHEIVNQGSTDLDIIELRIS